MEDDSEGMACAASQTTYPMAHVDAVCASASLNWTIVDGEGNCVPPAKWHDFRTALHTRALLGEDEFAPSKIIVLFGQQYGDLDWEN